MSAGDDESALDPLDDGESALDPLDPLDPLDVLIGRVLSFGGIDAHDRVLGAIRDEAKIALADAIISARLTRFAQFARQASNK